MEFNRSLVTRAASGDEAAVARLLSLVWPDAYRIAWSVLRDRSMAEDAAQEACARLWSSIGSLRNPEHFAVWFYRIVVNESRRMRQHSRRSDVVPADVPTENAILLDDRIAVRAAVDALEPRLRLAVVLRYYYRLRSPEIARVVGAPAVTVRWWLMLAHRRLARALDDRAPHSQSQTQPDGRYADESIAAS